MAEANGETIHKPDLSHVVRYQDSELNNSKVKITHFINPNHFYLKKITIGEEHAALMKSRIKYGSTNADDFQKGFALRKYIR